MIRLASIALCALLLSACSLRAAPASTPTLTSDQALQTARAIADATRRAASPTTSPTPIPPSSTPVLATDTPTPTATLTMATVTANYNAYVRAGPDVSFDWIDFLLQGQSAQVVGRYENPDSGTWWYIRRLGEGKDGWIWSGAVTLSGDARGVPLMTAPATPTPPPAPTSPPTSTASPAPTS